MTKKTKESQIDFRKIKKRELYTKERNDIVKKVDTILNINEKNRLICLNDVTDEQKENIIELVTDIRKFFCAGRWSFFKQKDEYELDTYLSLIRSLYKDEGYDIESISSMKPRDGKKVTVTVINIYKK